MKVNIRRVQSGVAAASTLLVATGGTLGCAEESQSAEEYGLGNEALNPGSGQLELQLGVPGSLNVQLVNSTTDEFVRVGETIKVALPAWLLWETLYPNDPVPSDDARLKKLKATVKVSFVDRTTTLSTKTLTIASWSGTQWALEAYTAQVTVPAKTDTIKMSLTIKDAMAATASATIDQAHMGAVPVFGGDLPNKSLLLDNANGVLRQRVVDGDLINKGSKVTIGFTDWRADQIVDKTNLNLQIGTATFGGRFGPYEAPIYGTLTYQVGYGVSFDGGATFLPEQPLAANTASRLVGAGRTDYEGVQQVPPAATSLMMYGHVKAILVADYSKYQNVVQKWYADNQQIQLKDAYDNPNGAFSNYTFQLH